LVVNHARVQDFRMTDGRVAGCSVVDLIENRTVKVSTRLIVNATGAWSAGLLAEAGFDAEFSLIPSKGIHILFSAERLPIEGATFLRATNGKRGLAMRRLGFVYVGTTDDQYDGSLDRPRATRSDVDEVLDMVSDCFPEQNLGYDDILATWAGVRPLIREEGKSTRDTSREDAVWRSPPGLITVAGGPAPGLPDRTATVPLPGAVIGAAGLEVYHAERSRELLEVGVEPLVVERLCWLYGRQLDDLLALAAADPSWLEPLHPQVPALRGEVLLAVEREMALTLTDFMDRRAALLLFSPDFGLAGAEAAADIMAEELGWDADRKLKELAQYRELAAEHTLPSE
jgi:glycerol-3-phosphate dehydrogenase